MPGRREIDEEFGLRTDLPIEEAELRFAKELLWPVAGKSEIHHTQIIAEGIGNLLRQRVGIVQPFAKGERATEKADRRPRRAGMGHPQAITIDRINHVVDRAPGLRIDLRDVKLSRVSRPPAECGRGSDQIVRTMRDWVRLKSQRGAFYRAQTECEGRRHQRTVAPGAAQKGREESERECEEEERPEPKVRNAPRYFEIDDARDEDQDGGESQDKSRCPFHRIAPCARAIAPRATCCGEVLV